jgi:hypothetical protein
MSLKRMSEVLAQVWGLPMEQVVGKGGNWAMSHGRDEIGLAATDSFHFPAIRIIERLQLSPLATLEYYEARITDFRQRKANGSASKEYC